MSDYSEAFDAIRRGEPSLLRLAAEQAAKNKMHAKEAISAKPRKPANHAPLPTTAAVESTLADLTKSAATTETPATSTGSGAVAPQSPPPCAQDGPGTQPPSPRAMSYRETGGFAWGDVVRDVSQFILTLVTWPAWRWRMWEKGREIDQTIKGRMKAGRL